MHRPDQHGRGIGVDQPRGDRDVARPQALQVQIDLAAVHADVGDHAAGRNHLLSQCLDRRIANSTALAPEVAAWLSRRNVSHAKASWRFTTENARIKLKSLYPSL
jgi:hypothetical protein